MKKLVILALALITFQANAQDKKENKRGENKERLEKRMELEPQEMAELQTKKMTLHLDLTEAQQKKVMALNTENAKKRKESMVKRSEAKKNGERTKPTKEEKLKMMNTKLDAQIDSKRSMKDILTVEQYEKWQKTHAKRQHKGGKMKKGGKKRMTEKKQSNNKELN